MPGWGLLSIQLGIKTGASPLGFNPNLANLGASSDSSGYENGYNHGEITLGRGFYSTIHGNSVLGPLGLFLDGPKRSRKRNFFKFGHGVKETGLN